MSVKDSKTVTMADVARSAGVSSTTVSLVINQAANANIPEATRSRVMAVVKELGYRPNAAARGIRTNKTQTIGVISEGIVTGNYAGDVIRGAQDIAWERGQTLIIFNTEGKVARTEAAVEILLSRRVEGILFATDYHRAVDLPTNIYEVPTVLANCFVRDYSLPSVVPDETNGGYTATKALLERGHHRIAFLSLEAHIPAGIGRLAGYKAALAEYTIPFDPDLYIPENDLATGGYSSGLKVMQLPNPPTALFCGTDRTAMGAYDAMRDLGLNIPNDISIVSYDNFELIAHYLRPGLTSVELPHYVMGSWAIHYLQDVIEGKETIHPTRPIQHLIAGRLVERQSIKQR